MVIKVSGKLQQPNPGKMKKGTGRLVMKVVVTPPGKEPRAVKVLVRCGCNKNR